MYISQAFINNHEAHMREENAYMMKSVMAVDFSFTQCLQHRVTDAVRRGKAVNLNGEKRHA